MSTTTTRRPVRRDRSHHHPRVTRQVLDSGWGWRCDCGGASPPGRPGCLAWRTALVQALLHARCLAA